MTRKNATSLDLFLVGLGLCAALIAVLVAAPASSQPGTGDSSPFMPAYNDAGELLLPDDYRRWVFVGASLGLSYSEGSGGMEMFHETLMEPTAYEHFKRTGEFRNGTMLALMLHGIGENTLPQRQGRFAGELGGLEMAVKDSRRSDRSWEYYGFGGRSGIRQTAQRIGSDACYSCHETEAAHDNVFMQFYPLLAADAPEGTVFKTTAGRESMEMASAEVEQAGPPVALEGLDPVLLIEGQEELGKPEIVIVHGGYTWQFVSEPTRARFEAHPERYSFRNDSCPVVAGAPIDPALFTVHEGRLYGFASSGCISDFTAEPERFLAPPAEG